VRNKLTPQKQMTNCAQLSEFTYVRMLVIAKMEETCRKTTKTKHKTG